MPPGRFKSLDFADQIETRLERGRSWSPLRRANLTGVRRGKLRRLYLTYELFGVTSDAIVLNLGELDLAFWIHDEGAAISETVFLDVDPESAAQVPGRIGEHRVFDLLNRRRSVMPCLVNEVRIRAHGIDLDAHGLELVIFVRQISEFRRTDEGKISGIEEENGPFAFDVGVRNGLELAVLEGLDFELGNGGIDDRLHGFSLSLGHLTRPWFGEA